MEEFWYEVGTFAGNSHDSVRDGMAITSSVLSGDSGEIYPGDIYTMSAHGALSIVSFSVEGILNLLKTVTGSLG